MPMTLPLEGEGWEGVGSWPMAAPAKARPVCARLTHPDYHGACVRGPDGNKLQAVCHSRNG